MTQNTRRPDSQSRRRLLKALGAGGSLASAGAMVPNHWRRPAVDAALLPVHAQTSGGWYGVIEIEDEANLQEAPRNTLFARLLDSLVPSAHAGAGAGLIVFRTHICIAPPVNGEYPIDVVVENFFKIAGVRFSGMLKLDNIHRILNDVEVGDNCPPPDIGGPLEARLNSIDSNAHGDLLAPGDGGQLIPFSLPMQPCNLPGLGACLPGGP